MFNTRRVTLLLSVIICIFDCNNSAPPPSDNKIYLLATNIEVQLCGNELTDRLAIYCNVLGEFEDDNLHYLKFDRDSRLIRMVNSDITNIQEIEGFNREVGIFHKCCEQHCYLQDLVKYCATEFTLIDRVFCLYNN